jgi:hypothetical protein
MNIQKKDSVKLEVLCQLGFSKSYSAEGRSSIADLFKPGRRCGIYVLGFSNDEWYCGQARDVARRFVQHRKNHADIVSIRFMEVEQERLDEVERTCIHTLEAGKYSLRNIVYVSVVEGETDFDLVMSLEAQNIWKNDLNFVDHDGPRASDESLRRRYHRKFEKFNQSEHSDRVIEALRLYAQWSIPVIKRSELSFWTVSCLPACRIPDVIIYARVNLYWQEVLNLSRYQVVDVEAESARF